MHSFQEKYPAITIELFQGTYDDVVYWIKNGVVDIGFLSASSAADLPIQPLYKDPLICVVPKGMAIGSGRGTVGIQELRNQKFVTQRESTDADIQKFMKENNLNVKSDYHVVDDLSTIAMVANGFGICLMPQMVMKDIPYEVDCYPLEEEAYRIVGIAALNPDNLAPAVRTFYNHVLEQCRQEE